VRIAHQFRYHYVIGAEYFGLVSLSSN